MIRPTTLFLRLMLLIILGTWSAPASWALSPVNVVVIANRADPDSLEIANYYCKARGIPGKNVAYVNYTGDKKECSWKVFEEKIQRPVLEHLIKNKLDKSNSVWITMPGLPYRVNKMGMSGAVYFQKEIKSINAAGRPDFFLHKNDYYAKINSISAFQEGYKHPLHMMLYAGNKKDTLALIDRSVKADGSFPKGTVYFFDGDGPRGSRKVSIAMGQRMLEGLNAKVERRPNSQMKGAKDIIGLYTGAVKFGVKDNVFLPGALADHLTSFGGRLHDSHGQMSILEFMKAGCSASFGTVVEPRNYTQKFPAAPLHAYYRLGFSAVESYWMSVVWPQQGLFIGDPLTRPYARAPEISFGDFKEGQTIKGPLQIPLQAEASNGAGVRQMKLYMNDGYVGTLGIQKLPPKVDYQATLGDWNWTFKRDATSNTGALTEFAKGLREQGYSMIGSNALVFLVKNQLEKTIKLSINTDSPIVRPRFLTPTMKKAEPQPVQTQFLVRGEASKGDVLKLEIKSTDGKVIQSVQGTFAESGALSATLKTVMTQLRKDLPASVILKSRVQIASMSTDQQFASLTLIVDDTKTGKKQPTLVAALSSAVQPGSKLNVMNASKPTLLRDLSMKSVGVAWLAWNIGPKTMKNQMTLKTTNMPDGRYDFSVVAMNGSADKAERMKSTWFVIKNHDDEFKMKAMVKKVPAHSNEVVVAKLETNRDLKDDMVRFYINGHTVLASQEKVGHWVMKIKPSEWGVGEHRLRADVFDTSSSKILRCSDNLLTLTITPSDQ